MQQRPQVLDKGMQHYATALVLFEFSNCASRSVLQVWFQLAFSRHMAMSSCLQFLMHDGADLMQSLQPFHRKVSRMKMVLVPPGSMPWLHDWSGVHFEAGETFGDGACSMHAVWGRSQGCSIQLPEARRWLHTVVHISLESARLKLPSICLQALMSHVWASLWKTTVHKLGGVGEIQSQEGVLLWEQAWVSHANTMAVIVDRVVAAMQFAQPGAEVLDPGMPVECSEDVLWDIFGQSVCVLVNIGFQSTKSY